MSAEVRGLVRRARSGTLATAERGGSGWPYASLVTVACDVDASPILLLSQLSDHTRNLAEDPRASLLIEAASRRANPQTGPRATLMGRIEPSADERHRRRFLARHPSASLYAGFADFGVYRMTVERAHSVGGFARAVWMDGAKARADADAAATLAAAEPGVLEHMNADHAEAIGLYARRLLGRRGDGWSMVAVDPDGCDLRRGAALARLDFPEPVGDVGALREALVSLAHRARAADG